MTKIVIYEGEMAKPMAKRKSTNGQKTIYKAYT